MFAGVSPNSITSILRLGNPTFPNRTHWPRSLPPIKVNSLSKTWKCPLSIEVIHTTWWQMVHWCQRNPSTRALWLRQQTTASTNNVCIAKHRGYMLSPLVLFCLFESRFRSDCSSLLLLPRFVPFRFSHCNCRSTQFWRCLCFSRSSSQTFRIHQKQLIAKQSLGLPGPDLHFKFFLI